MRLNRRDRTFTLVGILLALFLGAIDQTIVSTALPKIVEDLHGLSRYAWVATSYLLASTVLVPIYGKLADMYSRKRIELAAVVLFLSGSFLCGISGEFGPLPLLGDGMSQLIVFRGIQGLGGAGLFALAFIIIADLYPPAERGKYQGFVGGTWGVASILGPLIGGFLTDYGGGIVPGIEGWRWVFYVNLPVGAVALWFIVTRMPTLPPAEERRGLDYASALLLVCGLVPLVLGLQVDKRRFPWLPADTGTDPLRPWDPWVTPGLLLLALVGTGLFVRRSLRSTNPILDMNLFRNRVFSTSNAAAFFFGAAFLAVLIFLPLFLVNVVGVSATGAGVALIPLSMGLVFGSVASGQLVSRFGHYRRLILGGGLILLVGLVLLSRMTPDIGYWRVTVYMVICGVGIGPSLPLYTLAIQNAVDVRKIGQATSASQFFRQIGGTVGAAAMGTVLALTLAFSFMEADLPESVAGRGFNSAEQRLASTGSSGVAADVRAAVEERIALIRTAAAQGDPAALDRALAEPGVPAEATSELRAWARGHRGYVASPPAEVLATSEAALRRHGEEEVDRVARTIEVAFTRATTRIYFLTIFVVLAAWTITLFLPELPLRRTHDRPPPPSPEEPA